jgi:toxin ParE1/3/4
LNEPKRYRLSADADADLLNILEHSGRQFGASQRRIYAELIEEALALVAADPERNGSTDRGAIEPGFRSYPVRLAGRKRTASRHILFYKREGNGILVLRILHDAMDFPRHLRPAADE